jgi:hypothetical protein
MNRQRLIYILISVWLIGWLFSQLTPPSQTRIQAQGDRGVIQAGELAIMVMDTDAAVETAVDLVNTFNSYILKQRVWDGEDRRYRYANLTIGVAADDFEGLTRALRTLGQVQNETASGQDISDERLDLNSRLSNLYATQTRLRTFLDQAQNITETLTVHQELIEIEGEIGQVQGRINFLSDKAEAATITLILTPYIPTPTPTATTTPTPTPTATPLPTPDTWRPGDTAETAKVQLQNTAQTVADVTIYRSIVCGPWLLLLLLLGTPVWLVYRRQQRQLVHPAALEEIISDEEE